MRLFLVRIAPDEDDLGEDNLFVKIGFFSGKICRLTSKNLGRQTARAPTRARLMYVAARFARACSTSSPSHSFSRAERKKTKKKHCIFQYFRHHHHRNHFYRTRVRSLGMLVTNSLTNSLTD